MTDRMHASHTAGTDVRKLDPELSRHMIALGFDPEAPVYEAKEKRAIQDIEGKTLLYGRPGPDVLTFEQPEHEPQSRHLLAGELRWVVRVLVELMTIEFWTIEQSERGPRQFYIRGFLTAIATDDPPDAPRVHVFAYSQERDKDGKRPPEKTKIQIARTPSSSPASADTQLVFGQGSPVALETVPA